MGDLKSFTAYDKTSEVVFDTEAEAEEQQALDFIEWMKTHNDNPAYTAQTVCWAVPVQRLDGKWTYPCCCEQDYAGKTIEDYDESNYTAQAAER